MIDTIAMSFSLLGSIIIIFAAFVVEIYSDNNKLGPTVNIATRTLLVAIGLSILYLIILFSEYKGY